MQFCLSLLLLLSSIIAAPVPSPGFFSSLLGGGAKAVESGAAKSAGTGAAKSSPGFFGSLFKSTPKKTPMAGVGALPKDVKPAQHALAPLTGEKFAAPAAAKAATASQLKNPASALDPLTGMSTKGKLIVAGVATAGVGAVAAGGLAIKSNSDAKAAAEGAPVAQDAPIVAAPTGPSAFNQVRTV